MTPARMFRFTIHRPPGYDFSRWLEWFRKQGIYAEVRNYGSVCAIWREGFDAFDETRRDAKED